MEQKKDVWRGLKLCMQLMQSVRSKHFFPQASSCCNNQVYTLFHFLCFPKVPTASSGGVKNGCGRWSWGHARQSATRHYQYTAAKCSSMCLHWKSLKSKARNLCDRPKKHYLIIGEERKNPNFLPEWVGIHHVSIWTTKMIKRKN